MEALLIIGIIVLGLFGAPLFLIIGSIAMLRYHGMEPEPIAISNFFVEMDKLTGKPFFIPIPMFTFAGYLLAKSKAPTRIVEVVDALFGWFPGGVAIVTLFTCAFFTTFTGASGVTIIAIGGLLYPILIQQKYPENFSLGLITSSGSLGAVFFPCIPVFIYALVIEKDPMFIFAGGLIPGLVSLLALAIYAIFIAKKHDIPRSKFEPKRAIKAVGKAAGEIFLPIFLILGIVSGQFSSFNAAIITVVYVFILEVVIFREIHPFKELPRISVDSLKLVGAIFVIISMAMAMQNYIDTAEIPDKLFHAVQPILKNKYIFLLFLNVFLLIVGCMMDIFSAILTVVPLIAPLAEKFGIDPFHLAVIFLINLEIGFMTPPVGINLFISSFHFRKPVVQLYKSVLPYIALLFIALLTITYIPVLTLGPIQFYRSLRADGNQKDAGELTKELNKDSKTLDEELKDLNHKLDDDVDSGNLENLMKKDKKKNGKKKSPADLLKQLKDGDDDDDLEPDSTKKKKKSPKDLLKQLQNNDDDDDLEPEPKKKATDKKAPPPVLEKKGTKAPTPK